MEYKLGTNFPNEGFVQTSIEAHFRNEGFTFEHSLWRCDSTFPMSFVGLRRLRSAYVLLLGIVAMQFVLGCSNPSRFPTGELVMFTAFGPHAFEGNVFVARADGSDITPVLSAHGLRGFETAFGNSLNAFILVSTVESTGGTSSITNIAEYHPLSGQFSSLQQALPAGGKGGAVPSPDNTKLVATISPPGQPTQSNLWISDLSTKQFMQLTQTQSVSEDDVSPVWSPDGRQIVFVRINFFPLISEELMTVPSAGGQSRILLGTSDHVIEATYSPDGSKLAFISLNGLETLTLSTMQRTVIVSKDTWRGSQRVVEGGAGISWARTQDKIVLVLLDVVGQRDEVWTVSSSGQNFEKIFAAAPGVSILSITFIQN